MCVPECVAKWHFNKALVVNFLGHIGHAWSAISLCVKLETKMFSLKYLLLLITIDVFYGFTCICKSLSFTWILQPQIYPKTVSYPVSVQDQRSLAWKCKSFLYVIQTKASKKFGLKGHFHIVSIANNFWLIKFSAQLPHLALEFQA